MDKLWAPWRAAYISNQKKKNKPCILCKIHRSKQDAKNFILARSRHHFSVLNLYPYNNGHVMIAPNKHIKDFGGMSDESTLDLWNLVKIFSGRIRQELKPEGLNIGINLGVAAGAGLPNHMHVHIVPRWKGDTNFMSVVANTRVISQSLRAVYQKLVTK